MLHKRHLTRFTLSTFLLVIATSCIINDNIKDSSTLLDPGNDPNFSIVVNTDTGFEVFNRKVVVFDISIYAFASVDNSKLLHIANVLAQYLDNNEDGVVDNLAVHNALIASNGFMHLWTTQAEKDSFIVPNGHQQKNINEANIHQIWHANGHTGNFDNSIEATWNFISSFGYGTAYPLVFSSQANSEISMAMDMARGGNFATPPATYPANAWFTNTNTACDYTCQVTIYNYWILTSILGAQENRLLEVQDEWRLNTAAKVQNDDVAAWSIYTNTSYNLPTSLPDGSYRH